VLILYFYVTGRVRAMYQLSYVDTIDLRLLVASGYRFPHLGTNSIA